MNKGKIATTLVTHQKNSHFREFFFFLLKTMKNTIDYSKAPKYIQNCIKERKKISNMNIGARHFIYSIITSLDEEIRAWEATQENA